MANGFDFGVERLLGRAVGTGVSEGKKDSSREGISDGVEDAAVAVAERLRRRALVAKKREKRVAGELEVKAEGLAIGEGRQIPLAQKTRLRDDNVHGNGAGIKASATDGLQAGVYGEAKSTVPSAALRTVKSVCATGTFYLETFGCQMNDHDSEKVAGVLLARGYRQVEIAGCGQRDFVQHVQIREKAAQKVFSRLGEFREQQIEGKVIGVLGCLAQQEGEEIFERAPWVSLVCGSASYRKLPELIAELEAGNKRLWGSIQDTDETFETEMTQAGQSVASVSDDYRGCDKACSYCVVPFTRGPERSRSSASILEEVRQLADLGYGGDAVAGADGEFVCGSDARGKCDFRTCWWRWRKCREYGECGS